MEGENEIIDEAFNIIFDRGRSGNEFLGVQRQ